MRAMRSSNDGNHPWRCSCVEWRQFRGWNWIARRNERSTDCRHLLSRYRSAPRRSPPDPSRPPNRQPPGPRPRSISKIARNSVVGEKKEGEKIKRETLFGDESSETLIVSPRKETVSSVSPYFPIFTSNTVHLKFLPRFPRLKSSSLGKLLGFITPDRDILPSPFSFQLFATLN